MTAPTGYPFPPFNRLVRKEVALGAVREILPPEDHIGLPSIAPFLDVQTDDVIFDYIKGGLSEGLAPARADDAESELAQKDEGAYAQGRASVIDWALKDKYSASDVERYRDGLLIAAQLNGLNSLNLSTNFLGSTVDDFQARVARHDALRQRKLNNRLEWLIMTGLETGVITYNDGTIKFTVDFKRPANQQDQAPAGSLWDDTDGSSDPIGDLFAVNDFMWTTYKVNLNRAIISRRILHNIWRSKRFVAAIGGPGSVVGGSPSTPIDLNYIAAGAWNPAAALAVVQEATGIQFQVYDSVYRTRTIGSTSFTNNRFTNDDKVILLPDPVQLSQVDDTQIGFAKTLTSPHPEGNWQPGWYEWEDEKRDPWIHVKGTGIKAFPVFPFLEYSYVMQVVAPAS